MDSMRRQQAHANSLRFRFVRFPNNGAKICNRSGSSHANHSASVIAVPSAPAIVPRSAAQSLCLAAKCWWFSLRVPHSDALRPNRQHVIRYRGWKNNFKLANGHVTLNVGARVIA